MGGCCPIVCVCGLVEGECGGIAPGSVCIRGGRVWGYCSRECVDLGRESEQMLPQGVYKV